MHAYVKVVCVYKWIFFSQCKAIFTQHIYFLIIFVRFLHDIITYLTYLNLFMKVDSCELASQTYQCIDDTPKVTGQ